jgi:hypothetical protein
VTQTQPPDLTEEQLEQFEVDYATDPDYRPEPWITDPYSPEANSESFDLYGYLATFDARLFTFADGRKVLTRYDPLLFAIVYFPHHIRTDGVISFADPHFIWAAAARNWIRPAGLKEDRHAYVAPRDTGKSTWWFLLLPMWAAAHGHIKFAAAFAHSGTQSETHLHAFRSELFENERLKNDFPDFCTPARKPNGKTTADNIQMLRTKAGFAFAARGVDAANLGLKEKDTRPDLILLDDVEPDEASYSQYQMEKRRGTIIEAILPMNLRAHVVLVGTVTMPGSIVHQLVAYARGDDEVEKWVEEEDFAPYHAQPIVTRDDGTERSIWAHKWPLSFLRKIRHTRSFLKNFANDPMGTEGGYWSLEDFTYGELDNPTTWFLALDPTITTKSTSDPAGVAVISYAPGYVVPPEGRGKRPVKIPSRCAVHYAAQVKLVGEALRKYLLRVLQKYPRIRVIVVEGNQGGENWYAILHHMPVKVRIVWSTKKKEVRAADLLELYQHQPPRVIHTGRHVALEQQMASFPKGNDDMLDAVGSVCLRVLAPEKHRDKTEYPR